MKLRLQGNSVRLRLTRSEVERLREIGLVEESVDFGAGEVLAYRLQSRLEQGPVKAAFGLYAQSGPLAISIEKDFRCLTRRLDEQEPNAYPHPGQTSETRS
jgi:hypothetical protein